MATGAPENHAGQNSPASGGASLREAQLAAFLAQAGWGEARREKLNADASTRRYERLFLDNRTAMLMDAPRVEAEPCPPAASEAERTALGWNAVARLAASRVEAFSAVAGWLTAAGLSAPGMLAQDIDGGMALLEDLGDDLFARVLERGGDEAALYAAAGEVLGAVHALPAPTRLPYPGGDWPVLAFDALALRANLDLFTEWMPRRYPDVQLSGALLERWEAIRERLIARALTYPRALILRDTHAENLIWMPGRKGAARVGLLDFQDAVVGWGEWDLSMLLHDARRDVGDAAKDAALSAWLSVTGAPRGETVERLSVLGLMNLMRIMGVFARLVVRDGKPRYDAFQPRLRRLVAGLLDHPELGDVAEFLREAAPRLLAAED